ncbi:EAL domain-containing protein [Synechococcus sp. CCAP 1479/9]|uniref:EAL domain-containing response regulator n=1 Tax=Synechococcus sp. CCAP 1479/9 TaxID=1221593 RepID=UPI001C230600|nr:EAL domain-containing protein [Synechococcus sp. CCAP 1479/9]
MGAFSILVIDDQPSNFDVIEALLSSPHSQPVSGHAYAFHYANGAQSALDGLAFTRPDLILLDVMMPGIDGLELCRRLKAMPEWSAVPIIMVTALASRQDLARCLDAGADDFISKPINRLELVARTRSMLRIRQQYQELEAFNTRLEGLVDERTAQLKSLLYQDQLTGLPSRAFLTTSLATACLVDNPQMAVAYLDCDDFKRVNGAFGHAVGDQLLQAIAQRLQDHLRPGDLLARMGEDEFCFLLFEAPDAAAIARWVESVRETFLAPFSIGSIKIPVTMSIGIALGMQTVSSPEMILQAADAAMYLAKRRGKNGSETFDSALHFATRDRLILENDLLRALERGEFINYYQPILHLGSRQIVGFEALVRWQHPSRGLVLPDAFIPCLEDSSLVVPVGRTILRQACLQLRRWHDGGWPGLTMSVNLSARQFESSTLLDDIDAVLADTGVDPATLKLEITETAVMGDPEAATLLMQQIRQRKIEISIDDFGTGYSSLSHLNRFPIDNLKIDRSFVSQLEESNDNLKIVDTIMSLSRQLGLAVIAEGISTAQQLALLIDMDCEFGQGYLFSRPLPREEIEARFLTLQPRPPAPAPAPA